MLQQYVAARTALIARGISGETRKQLRLLSQLGIARLGIGPRSSPREVEGYTVEQARAILAREAVLALTLH